MKITFLEWVWVLFRNFFYICPPKPENNSEETIPMMSVLEYVNWVMVSNPDVSYYYLRIEYDLPVWSKRVFKYFDQENDWGLWAFDQRRKTHWGFSESEREKIIGTKNIYPVFSFEE